MGVTADMLKSQHYRNALSQRPSFAIVPPMVQDLEAEEILKRCLGKEEHFRNFERFFLSQIKQHGYQAVLQKYLVGGSEIANEMHSHIYMGYVHGLIHIGLALEFKQPLLLAEGLAQSAVHRD